MNLHTTWGPRWCSLDAQWSVRTDCQHHWHWLLASPACQHHWHWLLASPTVNIIDTSHIADCQHHWHWLLASASCQMVDWTVQSTAIICHHQSMVMAKCSTLISWDRPSMNPSSVTSSTWIHLMLISCLMSALVFWMSSFLFDRSLCAVEHRTRGLMSLAMNRNNVARRFERKMRPAMTDDDGHCVLRQQLVAAALNIQTQPQFKTHCLLVGKICQSEIISSSTLA